MRRHWSNEERDCESSAEPGTNNTHHGGHALPKADDDEYDAVYQAIDRLKPQLSRIGFGAVVGYCSGAAAKRIGKALAVTVGVLFMAVQGAVYTGYVDVDWKRVQDDAVKKIDTTGDGKLCAEDAKVYWSKLKKMLTYRIPSAGGFSVGFLYGVSS